MFACDEKGRSLRKVFDWIINPNVEEEIAFFLNEDMRFQIVVNPQESRSTTFINNVQRFLKQTTPPEELVELLKLQSTPSTVAPSRHEPLGHGRILINRGLIGTGSHGYLTCQWDVSTGQTVAVKAPIPSKFNKHTWNREIEIMGQLSHVGRSSASS